MLKTFFCQKQSLGDISQHASTSTVMPAKSDSDVICCLLLLSRTVDRRINTQVIFRDQVPGNFVKS